VAEEEEEEEVRSSISIFIYILCVVRFVFFRRKLRVYVNIINENWSEKKYRNFLSLLVYVGFCVRVCVCV